MSGFGGFGGFGQQQQPLQQPSSTSSGFGFAGGSSAGFGQQQQQQQQQQQMPLSSFSGFGGQQQPVGQFGFGQMTSTTMQNPQMQQQHFGSGGIPSSSIINTTTTTATTISPPPPVFGQSGFGGGGFGGSSSSSGGGGAGSVSTSVGVSGGTGFTGFGNSSNSFSQLPLPPASSSSSSTAFVGFGGSGGFGSGVSSSSSSGTQSSSFGRPQWQQQQQQQPTLSGFGTSPAAIPGFGTASSSPAATTNNSVFGSIATSTTNTTNNTGFGGFSGAGHTTSPMPMSSFSSSSSTMAPPPSSNMVFGSSSTVAATISNFTPTMTTTATTGLATAGFAPASTTTSSSSQQLNANATPFYSRSQDPSVTMAFSDSGGFGSSISMFPAAPAAGVGAPGGFGTSTSTETGMGTTGFGGSGGFGGNSVATTTFSPLTSSPPPPSSSGDGAATPSTSFVDRRIPRKNRRSDDVNVAGDSATTGGDAVITTPMTSEGEEQLSALRAKIREKREKLQKLKFGEQTIQKQSNSDGRKSLAATVLSTTRDDSRIQGDANADLAARNALRFSTSSSDRDQTLSRLMPADLKERGGIGSTEWSTPAQSVVDDDDDNDNTDIDNEDADVDDDDDLGLRNLSNAKSLVGTCLSMCPDEELIRREKEGDIQLLEVTDPGGLHPKEWTLRDTAVKRFRRSAADFKLDIPELIRPPDVLERVCGYLEEWVMERDRQGPDKRWAQQPSNTPPPLDVYQFIWDRTRMVRKDFILQNYIGTGGKCDARAVRCHERIARWHAMCEHQLSHIPEFVSHQSQQNIAELGQTMKTLNNYYDDASGRSLIEVENAEGTADSTQSLDGAQGCVSDIVMGKSPIDFDGRTLNNSTTSSDISVRIIGGNGMNSPTLGTAEPEMRGLYILLTLNNEGGMEVLKYSGRLCGQKPDVFYSKPVQLALSIFQAKKEQNYARFFSLMRSPSTPYLFACIMFKYVESMRKEALIIMSRTYGAKHKTTGQPFYDSYPIENLVKLLCYEDEEEARTACQHYGITVEGDQVLWRHGRFVEPRDPEKGHIIPLKPRKMIRTIESKLNGATRLSVCRGGVSGEGATLSITSRSHDTLSHFDRKQALEANEKARADEMQLQMEIEAKARAERQKIERERIRQEELAAEKRAKAEAAKRAALERAQLEKLRREQLMAEQRMKELEARRVAEEKAAAERAERERQERERNEREMARIRAEEEERERERQMLIEREREEEARRMADIQAAKERAEKEHRAREESRRLAELRRQAEEERIRKEKEEEALRIEMMWIKKIEQARKVLVWRLWRKQMLNHKNQQQSRLCLENLDPTTTHYPTPVARATPVPNTSHDKINSAREFDLESQIYRLATAPKESINLARMVASSKPLFSIPDSAFPPNVQSSSNVVLFKLVVILPKRIHQTGNLYDSMRMWVNSRLRPGCISYCTFTRRSVHYEIRAVAVIGNEDSTGFTDCNAALILLPSDAGKSQIEYPEAADDLLASSIPRIVLVLDDEQCMGNTSYTESILEHLVGPFNDRDGVVSPDVCNLESAFEQCCEAVVESHVKSLSEDCPSMVRVSLANFGFLCLQRLFQNMDTEGVFRSNYYSTDSFFGFVKETLTMLATELSNASNEIHETKQNWPPQEFYGKETDSIPAFFNGQYDLPFDWNVPFSDVDLEVQLFDSFQDLMVKESFINAVHRLGDVLTPDLQQQLLSMIDKGDIARCFIAVVSIIVNGELKVETREETMVYLPAETLSSIVERVGSFEVPSEPAPMPTDIPNYLFNQNISCPTDDEEEANYIEDEYAAEAIERNDNKRKPREKSDRQTPVSGRIKRIRSQEPLPMETVEQKRSKEFTSYLEALLSSGET